MLSFLFALGSSTHEVKIKDVDGHNFRKAVFHRDLMTIWVALLSSPDYSGHMEANTEFEKAFNICKNIIRFVYCDAKKNVHIPRRLNLKEKDLPQFCVFYPSGQSCFPANITGREMANIALGHYPSIYVKEADETWIHKADSNAILFTNKVQNPPLWNAIGGQFQKTQLKIGISRNETLAKMVGVKIFPSIVLTNYTHQILYDGEVNFESMIDVFKKFMTKRMQKMGHSLQIFELSEFKNKCNVSDTICIIDGINNVSEPFNLLRKQHITQKLEFFYGTDNFPIEKAEIGKITIVKSDLTGYIIVNDYAELERIIQNLIDDKVQWIENFPVSHEEEL